MTSVNLQHKVSHEMVIAKFLLVRSKYYQPCLVFVAAVEPRSVDIVYVNLRYQDRINNDKITSLAMYGDGLGKV